MTDRDAATAAEDDGAAGDEASDAAADGTDDEAASGEDLVAEIAVHDEELAGRVADHLDRAAELEGERDDLAAERDDLTERLQRTQADFQNYKKRAKRRQEEIRERATEDLIERLLEVRDNLDRALDQGEGADIRDGVEATRREFDRVLADEDVERIDPDPGSEVDPQRHEVLSQVPADQPEGTVAGVYRAGYEMAGQVLRPAQVTTSEGGTGDTS